MPKVCLSAAPLDRAMLNNHSVYRCHRSCALQVHIEFTEGEDKITLEGPTKDVQMVHGQIEAIVTDLVSTEPNGLEPCFSSQTLGPCNMNVVH